jgi:DNA mismatch repair protein MutL
MTHIRLLDPDLINQIAAGEVIERPASVIKELLENALDAGAMNVQIVCQQGGQVLIRVEDDGCGMGPEDLKLCVQRHTTSKLEGEDLWAIHTFGFRGEALASIGSVSRVTLKSCRKEDSHGGMLSCEGGMLSDLKPHPFRKGTCIEVRDLFFATPARLKFLRSLSVENTHIEDVVDRAALWGFDKSFSLELDKKKKLYPAGSLEERVGQVLGEDFLPNAFKIDCSREGYVLKGWAGLPTYNRASSDKQYLFVNSRAVKDKVLSLCVRTAFQDCIPQGRHPVFVLYLTVPLHDLDVNVHPAKTEVRFRDLLFLRQFLISALKQSLMQQGARVAVKPLSVAGQSLPFIPSGTSVSSSLVRSFSSRLPEERYTAKETVWGSCAVSAPPAAYHESSPVASVAACSDIFSQNECDLGKPLGQVLGRYIVAVNTKGLVLVDPHAAHERLLYEKMKKEWGSTLGEVQLFLLSLRMPVTSLEHTLLQKHQNSLYEMGVRYQLDKNSCDIQALPAIFQAMDPRALIKDILSVLAEEISAEDFLYEMRNRLMGHWACRSSIFLGKTLSFQEMESLLRDIENTPHSGQCNHGRPVYRAISLAEMDALFERT